MKKKALLLLVAILLVAILAFTFVACSGATDDYKTQNEEICDLISDEDSNKSKEKLDNMINNEKSESIIIPEYATEEQKQQLKEKKTYLQIVEKVSDLYQKKFNPVSSEYSQSVQSTMTGINNIYKSDDGYVFYVSAVNKLGDKYYNSNSLLLVKSSICDDFEELNNALNDNIYLQILYSFDSYCRCEDLNNQIIDNFKIYKVAGYNFNFIDMSTYLVLGSNKAPSISTFFYSMNDANEIIYRVGMMNYKAYSRGKTYNEFVENLKTMEQSFGFKEILFEFAESNLDWNIFCEESKQSAEAEFII